MIVHEACTMFLIVQVSVSLSVVAIFQNGGTTARNVTSVAGGHYA